MAEDDTSPHQEVLFLGRIAFQVAVHETRIEKDVHRAVVRADETKPGARRDSVALVVPDPDGKGGGEKPPQDVLIGILRKVLHHLAGESVLAKDAVRDLVFCEFK
jgi:hypothetical protein